MKKDSKRPFLLSGCKVQDGQGLMLVSVSSGQVTLVYSKTIIFVIETYTFLLAEFVLMQVTGVGVNTEWGQVMASVSEDNGEETPLQVLERFFESRVS